MLGTQDEPSGPDAWAARSWRAGTRRAYAQNLAKITEFQVTSGEASLARVLAEFLAARAEAGEQQSTLRGHNAAVRADEDLGWIGPTVQQLQKHVAQATSKVGLQPYLPHEGLCVLMERAELQPGALPMACVGVLCGVLWLRVARCLASVWGMYRCLYGSGSRIPKLVRRAGSHGLYRPWGIDTEMPCSDGPKPRAYERATICSLEAVLGRSTNFWRSSVQRTAFGILCAGVVALRVTLANLDAVFSLVGAAAHCRNLLRFAMAFQDAAVVGPLRLPAEAGARGATRDLTPLEVWAPNMYPAEAEPLLPAALHPPAWPEDLLPPHPPHLKPRGGGFIRTVRSRQFFHTTPTSSHRLPHAPQTPGRGGGLRYCQLQ